MSFKRLSQSFQIQLKCFLRWLLANFSESLTLFLCFATVFFLFSHIAYRFILKDLVDITSDSKILLINTFSLCGLGANAFLSAQAIGSIILPQKSVGSFLLRMGENYSHSVLLNVINFFVLIIASFVPLWFVLLRYFVNWSINSAIIFFVFQILFAVLTFSFVRLERRALFNCFEASFIMKLQLINPVFHWKLKSFLKRSFWRPFLVFIHLLLLCLLSFSYRHNLEPLLLLSGLAFLGLGLALTLCYEFSDNFDFVCFERGMGVSHQQYLNSLWVFIGLISFTACVSVVLGRALRIFFFPSQLEISYILLILKAFVVLCTPLLLINSLILQVDPRSFVFQAITITLCSLFFCSAIVIHPLFALGHFPVFWYGRKSQNNRFYYI